MTSPCRGQAFPGHRPRRQNIRLASELTGWELNVMSESQAEAKSETESTALRETFMKQLDVDADVASILVQEGFSTIEEIAYVPASELTASRNSTRRSSRMRPRTRRAVDAGDRERRVDGRRRTGRRSPRTDRDALGKTLARKGVKTREDLAISPSTSWWKWAASTRRKPPN